MTMAKCRRLVIFQRKVDIMTKSQNLAHQILEFFIHFSFSLSDGQRDESPWQNCPQNSISFIRYQQK